MRIGAMFATGVVGAFMFKLLVALLAPMFGTFVAALIGFLALVFKIGLFALVGFFVYRMFRRRQEQAATS